MTISNAERRQIENEMIFRRANEKVADELDDLDANHIDDGNLQLIRAEDLLLQFKCECSDENCATRIPLLFGDYQDIHTDRDTFIVLPNHQVESIETIVKVTSGYTIVRKDTTIAEPAGGLNETSVDNS